MLTPRASKLVFIDLEQSSVIQSSLVISDSVITDVGFGYRLQEPLDRSSWDRIVITDTVIIVIVITDIRGKQWHSHLMGISNF